MTILVVGDRAKVEPTLKDLPFAKVIRSSTPRATPSPPRRRPTS